MAENAISPEGKAQAEEELRERREVRRPEIVAAIKTAREFGDLKENAEYHAAREEQAHNEARIRVLEHHLASAIVQEQASSSSGSVAVGSRVRYRDEASGETSEVVLVHPLETDVAAGKISVESPIAKAMLGASAGDAVTLETRSGSKRLELLEVS